MRRFRRNDPSSSENDPSSEAGPTPFADLYPGAARGLAAEQARASGEFTRYDGLLDGDHPELDVFDGTRVLSASRLERLANTPYLYFLKHVLGAEPLDEPALEEAGWLDPLRRGSILHDTFETFVRRLDGAPADSDEETLRATLQARIDEEVEALPPPTTFVEAAARRELWADALVFLRAEANSRRGGTPHALEYGFGLPPGRGAAGAPGPARLSFEAGPTLRLRGQIDRIDRHPDGTYSIWDYKTGSTSSFSGRDILQSGQVLQWALYSYAFEALEGAEVREAGYFFTSAREMGRRIASEGQPAHYRSAIGEALARLAALVRSGTFAPNPKHAMWRYAGFERCIPDLTARQQAIRAKAWPGGRPAPIHLDN